MPNLKVTIARADGLPGFAAYLPGSALKHGKQVIELEEDRALVMLDVEAVFDDTQVIYADGSAIEPRTLEDRRREMIESLMHEFGHALEDFFQLEFSEEDMERITEAYRERSRLS